MKTWWADTLFKRLFVLMWVALVVSHLCAFLVVRSFVGPPGADPRGGMRLPPVLGSLPPGTPMPGGRAGPAGDRPNGPPNGPPTGPPQRPPSGPPNVTPGAGPMPGQPRPPPVFDAPEPLLGDLAALEPTAGPLRPPGDGLPAEALLLDYGVRLLVLGMAAWLGARWLSAPMRRLAGASLALGQSFGRPTDPSSGPSSGPAASPLAETPGLDETRGTLEVRQTAQVFNTMAQQLGEQFRAQGLLMAAISHDLRTPLARLRLRLEQMQAQPQAAACIADLREMDGPIGSVLDLVRDQQGPAAPLQRVDLLALVQALADDLGEQGHAVRVQGEPAVVLAQPTALGRVLTNLIGNALRHAGSAEVTVTTHHRQAHLCVDDRGPGIPPGQLDAVFKPFYRLEASGTAGSTGSGLGLHIARDLLVRQGGRLTLANRPGGGLRAEVVLPLG